MFNRSTLSFRCCRTYAFLQIRAPVLKEMYKRMAKLAFRNAQVRFLTAAWRVPKP